jgi:predicted dehydrogenase
MVEKIQVGVVGIGFGQQVHVPAFQMDDRCQVRALCASTVERAAEVAKRLNVDRALGDWQELVTDPTIDAVSIATPPGLQTEVAIAALSQGKAVFCEKPLARSLEDAHKLAALAEQSNVANMVDFEFPDIDEWRQAKTLLDQGGVGNLRHIAVTWNVETYANRMGLSSWKTRMEDGGGTLYSFVSHVFYYLEWFAGSIRRLVCSLFRSPGDTRPGDTLAVLCLELESGVAVSLSISSHAFLGSGHRVEFYGDAGTLVLDNPTADYVSGFRLLHGTRESKQLEVVHLERSNPSNIKDGRLVVVSRLIDRFVTWLETGVPGAPSFKDGLRVQQLLEAARMSHESGCWVNCSLEG